MFLKACLSFLILNWFTFLHSRIIADTTYEVDSTIEYLPPTAISISKLAQTELKKVHPKILCVLKKSDRMIRRHVGYRHDTSYRKLTRQDLYQIHHFVKQLSCSEFVWYAFSLCGFNMGYSHIETKNMAYHHNIYPKALIKVEDGTIMPGDILVYDFPLLEIKMEEQRLDKLLSGHVVIVVSTEQKIVVGSHGHGSTPANLPAGVGYRRLLKGWENWSEGRTLRAVYRVKSNSKNASP